MSHSEELFAKAVKYIPGGVNSPVRAFGSIGGTPRFIREAHGSHMTDEDGKDYIDYVGSWGPMILGHNHPEIRQAVSEAIDKGLSFGAATNAEVTMAKLICDMIPSIELIRMVNSGTEAVMSAIRTARGYTGRNKIVKFNGCYHGHSDGLLVKAGSGVMTSGVPDSLGVPKGCTSDTLTADYNRLASVQALFEQQGEEIAAIIIEPVAANMGVVLPQKDFLSGLRRLCDEYGALLIFDEVITGFRLSLTGAQPQMTCRQYHTEQNTDIISDLFHVTPDLTTYGKIIGAGMPVGAYGGRRDIMEQVSPCGNVYQAGTLSGNPVAMAAGIAQLTILKEHPEYYTSLNKKADHFFMSLKGILQKNALPCHINHIGSIGSLFFTNTQVTDYASAKTANVATYARYCNYMLDHGIYIAPAQFEAMFLSMAHTESELQSTLEITEDALLYAFRR